MTFPKLQQLLLASLAVVALAAPMARAEEAPLAVAAVNAGKATATPQEGSPVKITWLGHAAFEIVSGKGTRILIDPYIKDSPVLPAERKNLSDYKPNLILVSHSHFDHAGDAVELAKANSAPIISAYDYVSGLDLPEEQKMGGNVGGTFKVQDVTVTLVPAMHSSEPGGRPLGFVLTFDGGRTVYHTGDTWIFGDMALIQELYQPQVILMNAGGGPYTQDPKTAALAIKKYFKPTAIIPMHYGSFPPLAKEDDIRRAFRGDARLKVLTPGDAVQF